MPSIIVVGGGLAGLAAAAALGGAGFEVDVYESRPFLGGRAASFPLQDGEVIDNCQHVLLRCCTNLLDFYRRIGVADQIRFHRELYFVEPGGRTSTMKAGRLPPPLHFAGSFERLRYLDFHDKLAVTRAFAAIRHERKRPDLDSFTMAEWLRHKHQTPRAMERMWRQVLVSAVNEELDRMSARHGFQVFWLSFLARAHSYEMGLPVGPLGNLYTSEAWQRWPNVRIHLRTPVERLVTADGAVQGALVGGEMRTADHYISAVPFERVGAVAPELGLDVSAFEHSPITGIHLWFDRPVMDLPHATVLDRTIQWVFNKDAGRYLLVVISASRSLVETPRADVIALAVKELAEFFPKAGEAKLEKAHVIKEVRATFSAKPGLENLRPPAATQISNLYLAGDWTRSGWPATMEGAVRSGYLAAEAVTAATGVQQKFVIPDPV